MSEFSQTDWDAVIDINLKRCSSLPRTSLAFTRAGRGKIVNIASLL